MAWVEGGNCKALRPLWTMSASNTNGFVGVLKWGDVITLARDGHRFLCADGYVPVGMDVDAVAAV